MSTELRQGAVDERRLVTAGFNERRSQVRLDEVCSAMLVHLHDTVTLASKWLVAWRSGNALHRINEVALRWARLVLGWVTVYGQVNHLGMKPAS